jgi:hypothetical protein
VDAQLQKTHAKSGNQAPLGAAELEEDGHQGGVHQDPELLQGQLFQVMLNYFIFDVSDIILSKCLTTARHSLNSPSLKYLLTGEETGQPVDAEVFVTN